jgi:hypothetical protein
MPDIVLDYHRLKTPIDHPDSSVTRAKLEYPTENVSFPYLASIDKLTELKPLVIDYAYATVTSNIFADKAVRGYQRDRSGHLGRFVSRTNLYRTVIDSGAATADYYIHAYINGVGTTLGSEAVDLGVHYVWLIMFSLSGSTLKAYREDMTTPKITATNTAISAGRFGPWSLTNIYPYPNLFTLLLPPSSSAPPAQAILELGIIGSGSLEDPYSPSLSSNFAEILSLAGLPDFLYQEARKYRILKVRGFTEDEMRLLLGYVPQYQVDLDAVTWGAFELHPGKASTVVITVVSGNPYRPGAIERQKARARRVFRVPKDYSEAVDLYSQLKKDYPYWLAGKDSFAYQVLGWEVLDWFQNVDFYYGELVEHKTHYDQLKQVPEWEIMRRLYELRERLTKVSVLVDERDKHLKKLDEILRKGW